MDTKSIFTSKTFWLNVVGTIATLLALKGVNVDPDTQATIVAAIMAIANIVVRFFTSSAVTVTGAPKAIAFLVAAGLGLSLGACTAQQVQTAQTELSAGIAAACHDVAAAQAANPTSPVAPWAANACSPNGTASLVQNSATIQWLGTLAAQLAQPVATPPAAPAAPAS